MYEIAFVEPFAHLPADMRARLERRLRNIATTLAATRPEGDAEPYEVVLVIDAWRFQYRVEPGAERLVVEEALFLGGGV
jgi:hypothetical protein